MPFSKFFIRRLTVTSRPLAMPNLQQCLPRTEASTMLLNFLQRSLLLFVAIAPLARGKHSTCSWRPVTNAAQAEHDAWQPWCMATLNRFGDYICTNDAPHGANDKVADWGKIAPRTLELATPCGNGGYAGHHQKAKSTCWAYWWLICKDGPIESPGAPHNCFGLGDTDDCQWPGELSPAPQTLYIYSQWRNTGY